MMVTKEQALTCNHFKMGRFNWRRNGKTKTWKRSPERFQVPIKFGLYTYGYLTEVNAHLYDVAEDD
jgi:hypothetical protein